MTEPWYLFVSALYTLYYYCFLLSYMVLEFRAFTILVDLDCCDLMFGSYFGFGVPGHFGLVKGFRIFGFWFVEDWQWSWKTFFASGSIAICVFLYSKSPSKFGFKKDSSAGGLSNGASWLFLGSQGVSQGSWLLPVVACSSQCPWVSLWCFEVHSDLVLALFCPRWGDKKLFTFSDDDVSWLDLISFHIFLVLLYAWWVVNHQGLVECF